MLKVLEIGTPSHVGKGAEKVVSELENFVYPLQVEVDSRFPFRVSFAGIGDGFFGSVFSNENRKKLTFSNFGELLSLALTAEQIAVLNGVSVGLRLTTVCDEETPDKTEEKKPAFSAKIPRRASRASSKPHLKKEKEQ